MTKIAMVGALAALAWTLGARADDAAKARQDASDDVRKAEQDAAKEKREARSEAAEKERKADEKVSEAKRDASADAQDAKHRGEHRGAAPARTARNAFQGKQNFDVDGRIARIGRESVTIERKDLPAVTLRIQNFTDIQLDGAHASHGQLHPGQDVKASFNLEGDRPVAVEIKADSKKK